MRWLVLLAFAQLAVLGGGGAWAHSMPNSVVSLDLGADAVGLKAVLPLKELKYALEGGLGTSNPTLTPQVKQRLRRYLGAHIGASSSDGLPWSVDVVETRLLRSAGHDDLEARVILRPPAGSSVRGFTLRDDAITHEVRSHIILIFQRSDYAAGRFEEQPRLIGAMQFPISRLAVTRSPATHTGSFPAAFRLGVDHIASGIDHLLFLLTLLLAAPLRASAGRWAGRRDLRHTAAHLAAIVSAFTLGHSATLIIGAASGWHPPDKPVEVLIAASILVAAIQVWRPWFGAREAWIAAAFGLVHGLSFASAIGDYVLDPLARATAILGFNLGIEIVQLLVVAISAPLLAGLARLPVYDILRLVGAGGAGFAALIWICQRLAAETGPVNRGDLWVWVGGMLVVGGLVTAGSRRIRTVNEASIRS